MAVTDAALERSACPAWLPADVWLFETVGDSGAVIRYGECVER